MSQTQFNIPPIIYSKKSIKINNLLNGTSADVRFLPDVQYTAKVDSFVLDFGNDLEEYYQRLKKRSAVLEELQGEHS